MKCIHNPIILYTIRKLKIELSLVNALQSLMNTTTLGKFRRSRDMNDVTWLVERQIWACINHRYTCTGLLMHALPLIWETPAVFAYLMSCVNLSLGTWFLHVTWCVQVFLDFTRCILSKSVKQHVLLMFCLFGEKNASEHGAYMHIVCVRMRSIVYTITGASSNVTRVYVGARFPSPMYVY